MGKEIVPGIRDNYTFYESLVKDLKHLLNDPILLSKTGRNVNFFETEESVKHSKLPNEIEFLVTVRKGNHKYFQFKLRCVDLCGQPFFRFDSDGETHRNYDESIPLSEQQVTTPHFHHYNSKGVNIAFKTPELIHPVIRVKLEEMANCIEHFFDTAKMEVMGGGYPSIRITEGLGLTIEEEDPTANVVF